MLWNKLFISKEKVVLLLFSSFLFFGCKNEEALMPNIRELQKGEKFLDPVVQSVGIKTNVISINEKIDSQLALRYDPRPKVVNDYRKSKLTLPLLNEEGLLTSSFSWGKTGYKKLMVAIFKDIVKVQNNEISNMADIVWLWTPSANSDPGIAHFYDGKLATFENHKFLLASPPKNGAVLPSGIYVWCILAWDDYGVNIVAASREIPFEIYKVVID
jgi:hypothetical protein